MWVDLMVGGWLLMTRMLEQLQSSSTSADTASMFPATFTTDNGKDKFCKNPVIALPGFKEVLRRENKGLKVYPVNRS
jgi:hypothetical protein